jgi:hypothetical protein
MDIQKRLYERHRSWGSGPATDIDCILIEYDRSRPVALIEYKIEFARTYFLSHPNYQCIKRIADTCKLPFFGGPVRRKFFLVQGYSTKPLCQNVDKKTSGHV